MCEANAYVKNNGSEELLLESVDKITPEEIGRASCRERV